MTNDLFITSYFTYILTETQNDKNFKDSRAKF